MPDIDLTNLGPMQEFRFYGTCVVFRDKNGVERDGVLARITERGQVVEIMHNDNPVYGDRFSSDCIVEIVELRDAMKH